MSNSFSVDSDESQAALELLPLGTDYFIAKIRCRGLSATARVSSFMSEGLGKLFSDMADNWTGWHGKERWGTLEREPSIEAESDSTGHVTLHVRLADGAPPVWDAYVLLTIEAGALEKLASKARSFEEAHIAGSSV